MDFEFGIASIVVSVIFLMLFFLRRLFGRVGAYAFADDKMIDRRPVKFWIICNVIAGVLVGGFLQGTLAKQCSAPFSGPEAFSHILSVVCNFLS
tara:strand:- start:618 stop:899 length:282 start_codon:yes stop_codon:yes gene_type:complete